MKVQHKVWVVTGGGNGIGRALVMRLLAQGARVAALDLSASALEETRQLAASYGDKLSLHTVNVADKAAVEALPEQIIAVHGAVDGIINNAGIIQPFVRVHDLDYAAIDRVLQVNLYGVLYMTKTFLPYLLKRPEAHVVNVSSMGGFLPVPGQTVYGASKAAVKLFTEGLYSELLHTAVRVTIVFPGAIQTNITANSGVHVPASAEGSQRAFKALPADIAAKIIVDGIERDSFRVLVGSDATFMDRIYRLSPRFATRFIYKQMKSLLPS